MSLPTQMQRDIDVQYDARIARAIDRVLEAERVAQAAIAECKRHTQESLEHARQKRRTILEHAHERIVALHTRAARALEERAAQVLEPHGQGVVSVSAPSADRARSQAAIETLADRLTGVGDEEVRSP
jgi:vacuolar-type H+-ATPase subunit H